MPRFGQDRQAKPGGAARYAGLDGLRGVAVLAVLLFHGGVSWAPGGFLGVEVFFVLSGYLITSLLVAEWQRSSTIALGSFWARRARRLLPALFCLVATIGVYYLVAGPAQAVPGLKGDGISALTYFSNWHQIVAGADYFAATGPVSPLEHTWSLAIEEQFYLVWPVLVISVLRLACRRGSRRGEDDEAREARAGNWPLRLLLAVCLAGAIASALDMALLFDGGRNLNRIYYGTDTRASGLLIGAALAIVLALRRRPAEGDTRDRRLTGSAALMTPLAAGGSVAALLLASAASALPVGVPAADTLPQPPPQLRGNDAGCTLSLTDSAQYGVAPVEKGKETQFVYTALGAHKLTWSGSAQKTFNTCPPKRVLLAGDSLAFTLGVPWLANEERYGVQLAESGVLGCAFTTQGELDVAGTWEGQSAGCPNALQQWAAEKKATHAQAVIVELGYRDQFDWKIGGKVVHLGQRTFDTYVQNQIERLVRTLGAGGTQILFLSIPYTQPPNLPDGSPSPAASPARHARIDEMLEAAAKRHPKTVHVLDLDQTVSPGNHYNAKVNGQLCRFDGVHFSAYCSELIEPRVLGEVRMMLR